MFKYILYKLGLFCLNRLPIQSSYKLAVIISDIQWFFSFRDRKAVENNLKMIMPDQASLGKSVREVFRNFGRYLVEFFQMNELTDERFIKNNVIITGQEYLDGLQSSGKGGIIVTAHIGNWELGAVLLAVLGYPIKAVALPHKERPVNDLFNQRREEKGVTVIPTNVALRHCIEQLRDKKFVALVVDRDFGDSGIKMDFLGRQASIPKGAAMFSWKTGAPIVPVFLIRRADGKFDLRVYPPIEPPDRNQENMNNEDNIIRGIIKRYLTIVEQQIRAFPTQWLLFREYNL